MVDPNYQTSTAADLEKPPFFLNLTAAFIILRLFMGFRLTLSGLEKLGFWVGKGSTPLGDALAMKAYAGPGGWAANEGLGDGRAYNIAKPMLDYTNLHPKLVQAFILPLPYFMLVAGLLILLGLLNRFAWWFAGFIWFSLAFGQMLLPDENWVVALGLYVFMCAFALVIIDHNRLRITKF